MIKILSSISIVIVGILLPLQELYAQQIPIGDIKEEQIKIEQLRSGSKFSSFTNRSLWMGIYHQTMEHADSPYGWWNRPIETTTAEFADFFTVGFYEPNIKITNNSMVPYGENNDAAWYGRGMNNELTGGFWITSDYLTVTFRPQLVYQQNRDFEIPRFIPGSQTGDPEFVAEGIGNIIDQPFRFGQNSFDTSSMGYSSIRVHYNAFEAGFSTEPLWWGGNVKYPLVMSNNAPGMKHLFLGTRKPFNIPYVGSLEFKWVLGFPQDSEFFRAEDEFMQDRFMNAINISYSPAFLPNFHIGITRALHTYIDEGGLTREDLSMILDPLLLENFIEARGPLAINKPRNHLNSLYARWVWPESNIEIYGEFFRDDFSWDSRDLLMQPRHNSGYAFGLQKLFDAPLAEFFRVNLEFTNMTPSFIEEVRPQNFYYTDVDIPQGHTNRGQLLGAAIGPGSNSQFLSIDGYTKNGRIGVFARRLADNNHFHFRFDRELNRPEEFRQGFGDYWRNRTDLTLGARFLHMFDHITLQGEVSWTKLFNYGRFDYGQFGGTTIANFDPYDIENLQVQLSVSYRF